MKHEEAPFVMERSGDHRDQQRLLEDARPLECEQQYDGREQTHDCVGLELRHERSQSLFAVASREKRAKNSSRIAGECPSSSGSTCLRATRNPGPFTLMRVASKVSAIPPLPNISPISYFGEALIGAPPVGSGLPASCRTKPEYVAVLRDRYLPLAPCRAPA